MEQVVRITALVHGGDGLARDGQGALFVPLTAPGDQVRVAIDPPGKGGVRRARLLEVIEPGPDRVAPPCPHVGRCGGCDLQQLSTHGQQTAKAQVVAETMERVGRLDISVLQSLVPSPLPQRYRRRLRVQRVGDGFGYTMRGSHQAVRVDACLLAEEPVEQLARHMAAALKPAGLPPLRSFGVDVTAGRGAAHLELLEAATPTVQAKASRLLGQVEALAGLVLTGPDGKAITVGDPVLVDADHHGLRIRPDLFAQANRLGARRLAADVANTVAVGARVLELFAGAGTLTLAMAGRAGSLVATEGEGPALTLLRQSLAEQGHAARLVGGPAQRVVDGLAGEQASFDHLVMDPPRAGAKEALPGIIRLQPPLITYVSCDPATFARDARTLVAAGWQLRSVTPYDMFPHTHHIELMATFAR